MSYVEQHMRKECSCSDEVHYPGPALEDVELVAVSNEDDDDETVAGPKVLAHVDLAKTVCK